MSSEARQSQPRYWCHICNAEVPIYMAPDPTCQQCNEQFIEEVTKKSPISRANISKICFYSFTLMTILENFLPETTQIVKLTEKEKERIYQTRLNSLPFHLPQVDSIT